MLGNNPFELNEIAINSLLCGNRTSKDAILILEQAFVSLKEHLEWQDNNNNNNEANNIAFFDNNDNNMSVSNTSIFDKNNDTKIVVAHIIRTIQLPKIDYYSMHGDDDDNNESIFKFYNYACSSNFPAMNTKQISSLHRICFTSILLYNMGLIHHRDGIASNNDGGGGGMNSSSSNNNLLFITALDYYNKAFTIIETAASTTTVLEFIITDDIKMLLLCIMNNIGHIQSTLLNVQGTKHCVQWMLRILQSMDSSFIVDSNSSSSSSSSNHQHEIVLQN